MKNILYTLCFLLCVACSTTAPQKDKMEHLTSKMSFYKPEKLKITGDFDGDARKDTVFEKLYSSMRRMDLDSVPDPFQNDRDSITSWFDIENSELLIVSNIDTLHLGLAQGLYCMINIGDNNKDGKDEIAIAVDSLDYTKTNVCTIYTLCHGEWTLLKKFGIHEDTFDAMNDESTESPTYIKDYLEQKQGRWWYSDYLSDQGIDTTSKLVKWQELRLPACP